MSKAAVRLRRSVEQVKKGTDHAPKSEFDGVLPSFKTDANDGEILVFGWAKQEAL